MAIASFPISGALGTWPVAVLGAALAVTLAIGAAAVIAWVPATCPDRVGTAFGLVTMCGGFGSILFPLTLFGLLGGWPAQTRLMVLAVIGIICLIVAQVSTAPGCAIFVKRPE
ncbi:MAG: hypothetical protein FWD68_13655 [Alphaproteobacteria bacterium]|nr:hypothetical protein [Alphaproteobacteria bacterium]